MPRSPRRLQALAIVLAGCAWLASTAGVADAVKLRVNFDPDVAGAETTLKLGVRIGGPGNTPPPPVSRLALRLPSNMGLGRTTLGVRNCYPRLLLTGGFDACSVDARLGFGNATAVVPVGSQDVREKVALEALMGPPVRNHIEVLFYLEGATPVLDRLVLPSVLSPDNQPFGEQLDTAVPIVPTWPEGPELALETFNSTIGPLNLTYTRKIGGHVVFYHPTGVKIPRGCPSGGFPFAATVTFTNGRQVTARYTVPCPDRPNRPHRS